MPGSANSYYWATTFDVPKFPKMRTQIGKPRTAAIPARKEQVDTWQAEFIRWYNRAYGPSVTQSP